MFLTLLFDLFRFALALLLFGGGIALIVGLMWVFRVPRGEWDE